MWRAHGTWRRSLAAAALVLVSAARPTTQAPGAPPPACDSGLVQLPANINGRLTICSALAAQVPALVRQLESINTAFEGQQRQLTELSRLIRGVNSVGQNIGAERQSELLRNVFAQLQVSQRAGTAQVDRQIAALAGEFEQLRDQMLAGLTNRTSSDRVRAAFEGPLGDAIAQLDFSDAERQLAAIQSQLQTIGTQVAEVNQRAASIQAALDQQRMELPRVSGALAAADIGTLQALTAGSLPNAVLEEAFRSLQADGKTAVARRFFENATTPAAIAWFDAALASGLDPNLRVPSEYYGHEALLIMAMRAGNAAAAKVLLKRQANPHPYQNLAFTSYGATRFIVPLVALADDERMTLMEKQEVAKAFLDAGLVVPRLIEKAPGETWTTGMYAVKEMYESAAPKLGVHLTPSEPCCSAPTTVCRSASARTGEDWCAIVARMPKVFDKISGRSSPLHSFELQYLLAIDRNKAYFLASTKYYGSDYVLVEASKDASSWVVHKYMRSMASMGVCKPEASHTPDWCWRRIPIQRIAGTNQARFDDWGIVWNVGPGSPGVSPPPPTQKR
jgi:hypothetical protein